MFTNHLFYEEEFNILQIFTFYLIITWDNLYIFLMILLILLCLIDFKIAHVTIGSTVLATHVQHMYNTCTVEFDG